VDSGNALNERVQYSAREDPDARSIIETGSGTGIMRGRMAKRRGPRERKRDDDELMVPPEERMKMVKESIANEKAKGDLDRVVELQIELMALTHLQHGAASIEMAHAYWTLSDTYLRKQLAQQALEHAQKAYKITVALADSDASVKFQPTILLTLGMCYTLLKKNPEAQKWLQKALDLTRKLYGEDHPACVLVHMGFANLQQLQGDLTEAEDHMIRAAEIKEHECHERAKQAGGRGPEGENEELAEIYAELGKIYTKQELDDQAKDMYGRALSIYEKRVGATAPPTGRIAQKLATLESKLGYYDEAVGHFRTAAESLEEQHGDCHKKTVDVWRKLCLLLVKLKRFSEAQEVLHSVITSEKVLFGPTSINLVESYKLLAMVFKVDGKRREMISANELILAIYHKKYGPKDQRTRDLKRQLSEMTADLQAAENLMHRSHRRTAEEQEDESPTSPVDASSSAAPSRTTGSSFLTQLDEGIEDNEEMAPHPGTKDVASTSDDFLSNLMGGAAAPAPAPDSLPSNTLVAVGRPMVDPLQARYEEDGEGDDPDGEEGEEEEMLEHEYYEQIHSWLCDNASLVDNAFQEFDPAGSGLIDAKGFLQVVASLARNDDMPLDQSDLGSEVKEIFRIVGHEGGQVKYRQLASAMKAHAAELLAEQEEGGDEECGAESAGQGEPSGEAAALPDSTQKLEQAKCSAKTALQLELEALAAQAKEAARAAMTSP